MSKLILSLLITGLFGFTAAHAQIDYNETIQPIFNNQCTVCHGGLGGVTLSSYEEVMSSIGASYDTLIVLPGNPEESPLVDVIASAEPKFGSRMPPGDSLSTQQIEDIIQWIKEGAHEAIQTSVDDVADLPTSYILKGNYPNPFNPSTIIQFEAPERSDYLLSIYSVTGTLLREQLGTAQPGRTEISVNLSSEPTGIYLYRIRFTNSRNNFYTLSGQMTLVK